MGRGNGANERERRGCQRNRKRAENKVGRGFSKRRSVKFQRHQVGGTPKRLLVTAEQSVDFWVWNLNCLLGVREGMGREVIKPANVNCLF